MASRVRIHASFCVKIEGEGVGWRLLPPNDTSRVVFVINDGEETWGVLSVFPTHFDMSGVTSGEGE